MLDGCNPYLCRVRNSLDNYKLHSHFHTLPMSSNCPLYVTFIPYLQVQLSSMCHFHTLPTSTVVLYVSLSYPTHASTDCPLCVTFIPYLRVQLSSMCHFHTLPTSTDCSLYDKENHYHFMSLKSSREILIWKQFSWEQLQQHVLCFILR